MDVADFLRRRLFESDTSIIMTSATLAIRTRKPSVAAPEDPSRATDLARDAAARDVRRWTTSPAASAPKRPR